MWFEYNMISLRYNINICIDIIRMISPVFFHSNIDRHNAIYSGLPDAGSSPGVLYWISISINDKNNRDILNDIN